MKHYVEHIYGTHNLADGQTILANSHLNWVQRSLACGYVSTKEVKIEEYDGRYGKGLKVYRNNPRSNRYCIVDYWVAYND